MSQLPKGWTTVRVGDLLPIEYGKSLPERERREGTIRVYGSNGAVDTHSESITGAPCIVIGRKGSIGALSYSENECWPIDTTYFVDKFSGVNAHFAFMILTALPLKSMNRSSAIPGLNREDVYALNTSLPPLNEQKRIVEKLESLQARSRRAKAALDEVPALLEKLRQSILAAAFRGDLTKEWREKNPNVEPASALLARIRTERRKKWEEAEFAKMTAKGKKPTDDKWKAKYKEPEPVDTTELPELPEGWCWASLDELLALLDQGWSPQCESSARTGEHQWAVMKTTAVQAAHFDEAQNKVLPSHLDPRPDAELQSGDLLITRAGPRSRAGVTCLVRNVLPRLMACDKVYRFRVVTPVCRPDYIELFLNSHQALIQIEKMKTGISESGVNLTREKFLSLPVPVPPLSEQHSAVLAAGQSVAAYRRYSHALSDLAERFSDLDRSLLAKAFRGELVAQDPNDEPADVMLARVKAAADDAAPKGRGRPARTAVATETVDAGEPSAPKKRGRPKKA